MSTGTKEVVELFFSCARIMDNISHNSIASYVISMTRQASHVMEVYFTYSMSSARGPCLYLFVLQLVQPLKAIH
jgi:hypothetical protein